MTAQQAEPGDALAEVLMPDLVAVIGHLVTANPAVTGPPAGHAPIVVKVRLSGDPAGIAEAAAALADRFEVVDRSGPRPNRYDPGERVYLTICT